MSVKEYKLVIFDLDGTLFYTSDDIANSMNTTLEEFGFDKMDNDTIIQHVGGGIHNSVNKVFGDAKYDDQDYDFDDQFIQKVVKRYKQIYSENFLETTRPYPGVEETLEKLSSKDIEMAVISNKIVEYTEEILKHYQLDKYFQIIMGGDSLDRKKPDPAPLYYVIEELDVDSDETLFIGDTANDIKAAKNANIDSCAVTYGMRSQEWLEQYQPDYFLNEFEEVLKLVNKNI